MGYQPREINTQASAKYLSITPYCPIHILTSLAISKFSLHNGRWFIRLPCVRKSLHIIATSVKGLHATLPSLLSSLIVSSDPLLRIDIAVYRQGISLRYKRLGINCHKTSSVRLSVCTRSHHRINTFISLGNCQHHWPLVQYCIQLLWQNPTLCPKIRVFGSQRLGTCAASLLFNNQNLPWLRHLWINWCSYDCYSCCHLCNSISLNLTYVLNTKERFALFRSPMVFNAR